jgi:hypothetical protein
MNLLQVTEKKAQANQEIDWRNRTNVGFNKRFMGFYESPQEILARTSDRDAVVVRCSDRVVTRFGCRTIYLYTVLIYRG